MPKPVEQYVYLVPQLGENNQVNWTWIYKGQSGPASSLPPIDLAKGSGQNDILFSVIQLQPQQQEQQIKFAGHDGPDTSKAISIAVKQPGLPQKPGLGINSNGQIKNITFEGGGAQLLLENINSKKVDLVYSLRFVDAAKNNQTVTPIDPEIRNGGGGGKFYDFITVAPLLLIGAVAGALIGLALARWALKWR